MIGVLLAATAGSGAMLGAWSVNPAETYIQRRAWVLSEAAKRAPKNQVLLIGDSLSERSGIVTLCDRPVFNAGVSAARLADVAERVHEISAELEPSLTFIALGVNDARLNTPVAEWQTDYEKLIDGLKEPMVLVSLPDLPIDGDRERVRPFNSALEVVAWRRGTGLVRPFQYEVSDGLHQSSGGAAVWRQKLEEACSDLPAPLANRSR